MAASASMPPTPDAEHPEPVDHGRVGVHADEGVAVGEAVDLEDDPGQVFQVDLVADPGPRGHDPEVLEGPLRPRQQLIALQVALVLDADVRLERPRVAGALGDHRVVDHELDRHERVDPRRIAADLADRVAHGGQVDDRRDAGQVLHEHPLGAERDLVGGVARAAPAGMRRPGGQPGDVRRVDPEAVLVTQQVLQEHLQRVGQPGHVVVGETPLRSARSSSSRRPPTVNVERVPKLSGWAGAMAMPPFCPLGDRRNRAARPPPGPTVRSAKMDHGRRTRHRRAAAHRGVRRRLTRCRPGAQAVRPRRPAGQRGDRGRPAPRTEPGRGRARGGRAPRHHRHLRRGRGERQRVHQSHLRRRVPGRQARGAGR